MSTPNYTITDKNTNKEYWISRAIVVVPLVFKEINGEFNLADFMTYIEDLEYKEDFYRILSDYQDKILESEFDDYIEIIKKWIKEKRINNLKEQLKNETDINKKEEINDLIIKIKKGSED